MKFFKKTYYNRLLFLLLTVITTLYLVPDTAISSEKDWGPWPESEKFKMVNNKNTYIKNDNIIKQALTLGVRFFQKYVSPVDGDKCPMYPTCSAYSISAIKKHGAAIGFIMTADRLLHEVDEQKFAPLIKKYGRYRFFDPLEDNDFWWYKKHEKH